MNSVMDSGSRGAFGLDGLHQLLNEALEALRQRRIVPAFRLLGPELSKLRDQAKKDNWFEAGRELVQRHELFSCTHEDPYTSRAYEKPRGYAGDAVMLDYIYSGEPPADVSEVGRNIFFGTTRVSMGLSVIYRRDLLRAYINDAIAKFDQCRILSVASGHCREVEGSLAESQEFNGRFFAWDQDKETCDEVRRRFDQRKFSIVAKSIRGLFAKRPAELDGKDFQLIYSAGLLDYLEDRFAQKLLKSLASLVAPKGRLVVANFLPQGFGRGYMEWFMDWNLILRSEAELCSLLGDLEGGSLRSYLDPHDNVAYAEWSRDG